MQFAIIIELEKEVANKLNYTEKGIYIQAPYSFCEFNCNNHNMHSKIQNRVFWTNDANPGDTFTVCFDGYEPQGPFSVPDDKEFKIVSFPNKPVNTKK